MSLSNEVSCESERISGDGSIRQGGVLVQHSGENLDWSEHLANGHQDQPTADAFERSNFFRRSSTLKGHLACLMHGDEVLAA